ncbi:LLM class flavin-dependent oxidoreductase [Sphingomonas sp. KC8]|uniref:LLM class flavin-dependent oxidoreductase n=1 Tax=Sphingomonas sp. KC8 TaxID=1030157 RepID=UPI0004976847|nr:LLM class flavin-dependent oxidoreductase [Sphingomonas sp. KC8]ARS29490.1 alkanesulfonate monooxygenase [Sphingomonas sp. KC8]
MTMSLSHPVYSSNKLKLGVFCVNNSPALTTVEEMFKPNWTECLRVAHMADDAGLEVVVPIARWKGYVDGVFDHSSHDVMDPFIYAGAVAQATRRIGVFATTHAPTVHPLVVAKQAATIDAISGGRFGMNVVGGWNRREFDMFGIELLAHTERYEYLAEWLTLIRRLWSESREFDFESQWFSMKGALSRPQPIRGAAVPIMNAGYSESGMHFAARHSDLGLIGLFGENPEQWRNQVDQYKQLARGTHGRDIQVWTNIHLVLKDTNGQARDYVRHYSEDHADRGAVDSFIATMARENKVPEDSEQMRFLRRTVAVGAGMPVVGDAETVAQTLVAMSQAGIDGIILSAIDYVDSLSRLERDVLPLLVAAGIRQFDQPVSRAA